MDRLEEEMLEISFRAAHEKRMAKEMFEREAVINDQLKLLEMQLDHANNNIDLLKEAIELKGEAISLYKEVIQHYKSEVARLSSKPLFIPNLDNQKFGEKL